MKWPVGLILNLDEKLEAKNQNYCHNPTTAEKKKYSKVEGSLCGGMERGRGEEGSANYVNGGYHPVDIGDAFNGGRYVVQSKLGWGAFSTVWLAWDTHLNKYVALKITMSKDCLRDVAQREVGILKYIAEKDPEDKQCVVKLLDDFVHTGPNGNHVCLVLEHLGDNLRTLLKHHPNGIPLHMVKKICFHILSGLCFLHGKLSFIHTDLKPENILLPCTIDPEKDPKMIGAPILMPSCINAESAIVASSSSASMAGNQNGKSVVQDDEEEELGGGKKELGGRKEVNPWQRFKELKINSPSKELIESLDHHKCKIADLGNAVSFPNDLMAPIQTLRYKCPETILRSPYDASADLWSVACIAYELATGEFLFDPQGKNRKEKAVNHLGLMMELLGPMPGGISMGGKLSEDYFDGNRCLRGYRKLKFRLLISELQDKYGFAKKDAYDFKDFLFSLLIFSPRQRPTAMVAIDHAWLNPVARLLSSSSSSPQDDQKECDEVVSQEKTTERM